jgi:membrane protein
MKPTNVFRRLVAALVEWIEVSAPRLAAALAYYGLFSMAPLALLAVGVAGLLYKEEAARERLVTEVRNVMGPTSAGVVEDVLKNTGPSEDGQLATALGAVLLLFGASGVFLELQAALNLIWKVPSPPGLGLGLLNMLRHRLLSFAVVLITGVVLLASVLLTAFLGVVGAWLPADIVPGGVWVWKATHTAVSLVLLTLMFAVIYKALPDAPVPWRHAWGGALLAAILFTLGKYGIGLYLGYSNPASTFGAAGSLVVLLAWVYYSSLIFLYGAVYTHVRAQQGQS